MKGIEKAHKGIIAVLALMLVSITRRLPVTRRFSSGIATLALAGIVLLVVVGGASAVDITGCTVISNPGVYTITADITNATMPATQYVCIDIQADDVILDGGGHLIDGVTATASRSGIRARRIDVAPGYNVTIRNVEITNFDNGIRITGLDSKFSDVVIENCLIHDNGAGSGQGIYLRYVCDSTISNNDVYNQAGTGDGCESGGNGIFLLGDAGKYDWARNNIITYNNAHDNVKAGIFIKACPDYNTISYNNCWGNGEVGHGATGGIVMRCKKCDFNNITHNDVSNNIGDGIYIGGNHNTIEWNAIINNSDDGIDVGRGDGGDYNELYHNTVCDNGGADIRTCGGDDPLTGCCGNHGDDNTCDTCSNYNDDGEICCSCDCPGEIGCVAEDGAVFGCGDTVTKNCTFNGDMICSTNRYGLIIGADNITIDGAGYALERADPGECNLCPSAGVLNKGYGDVTITNLEIKHFCTGVYLNIDYESEKVVYRNTVENCNIHHNGNATSPSATYGIKMRYVFNSTIRNNSIHDQIAHVDPNPGCENGGNGLFSYEGEYNNIIGNRFYNNQKAGMLIKMKPRYWNISHNHLWNNGQGGIVLRCKLCDFNLIEHNNASDNYGSGIFIGGNDNIIRYNTVCNNKDGGPYYEDSIGGHGYGINIGRGDGSLDNTLISNTVCGNDYLDIRVVTGVTGNTGDENTCNTTYNYNDEGASGCTYLCSTLPLKGDLNGDDKITPADAAIALQMAVRGEWSEDADVSGDHKVTSLDALLILQAAAGV